MRRRVLLTGFQPFGDHAENPSEILVSGLLGQTRTVGLVGAGPFGLESVEIELSIEGEILTVDETGSGRIASTRGDVDAIIHVGLKESAERIHLEMCAVNRNEFRIPDNAGRQVEGDEVIEGGLSLLHSTAHRPSLEAAYADLNDVVISEDCGRFVCNETYYRTLHAIEAAPHSDGRPTPVLFVHIPPFEFVDQTKQESLLLDLAARMVQKPTIQVVGGVVVDAADRMLACRRAPDEAMGGWWEFPGGKVDATESEVEALGREMREELGLAVEVGSCLGRHSHDYGSMIVHLAFYACTAEGQTPKLRVHDDMRWLTEDEIESVEWLPPDVEFVQRLAEVGFAALRDQS